ncbi:Chaperone protein TorD [Methylobacterium adhaesivum]|uniref:Molecular chaperone TorD family protein n=1 Tax=Methylobacterium adhaesivum TaxID=333297 RepID=A0ABT8BFP9_9HYPH|nr:molecular chaperone TorD family protein [Methylobacterium adhaesivum]MDN3590958.1 molecular chaperone TorD family protein [Methylobacterium adhaesivum]GJD29653.1 Chaperone protein TorD [Methylobacterium adhaesivum]
MRSVGLATDHAVEGRQDDQAWVSAVDEVDHGRARLYDLLAVLLGRAPHGDLLGMLGGLEGDDSTLGRLVEDLARASRGAVPEVVAREYHDLFIGVGRGELLPYASYYRTGFLNERPLARVREDLRNLGIERDAAMTEPEDHLAILFDCMAGLVSGRLDAEPDAARAFFVRHIEPWAGRFFADLERAKAARFYRSVGGLGSAFVEIETQAFAMDA